MSQPTKRMLRMLRLLYRGEHYAADCRGRSEFGGASRVVYALRHRGLVRWRRGDYWITAAGRALLESQRLLK